MPIYIESGSLTLNGASAFGCLQKQKLMIILFVLVSTSKEERDSKYKKWNLSWHSLIIQESRILGERWWNSGRAILALRARTWHVPSWLIHVIYITQNQVFKTYAIKTATNVLKGSWNFEKRSKLELKESNFGAPVNLSPWGEDLTR